MAERHNPYGTPSAEADRLNLRVPEGLRSRIREIAKKNGRSSNQEIVLALEAAFPAPIQPESVNEALLEASRGVLTAWESVLSALGQDPLDNAQLMDLAQKISEARRLGEISNG